MRPMGDGMLLTARVCHHKVIGLSFLLSSFVNEKPCEFLPYLHGHDERYVGACAAEFASKHGWNACAYRLRGALRRIAACLKGQPLRP